MIAKSTARIVVVAIAFGAASVVLASCKDRSSTGASATAVTTTTTSATAAPAASSVSIAALPPLDTNWLVHLPLNGFGNAMIAAPTGATSPRPILIGVHALRDRPEWACGEWLGVTRGIRLSSVRTEFRSMLDRVRDLDSPPLPI